LLDAVLGRVVYETHISFSFSHTPFAKKGLSSLVLCLQ
jgi:hypothetical protein